MKPVSLINPNEASTDSLKLRPENTPRAELESIDKDIRETIPLSWKRGPKSTEMNSYTFVETASHKNRGELMTQTKITVKVDADLKDIVPGFIEKRRNELPALKDALGKKNFELLQYSGHKLKGNAGGYGFDHLGAIGAQLESCAKAKDALKVEGLLKELDDYFSRLDIVYEDAA